jgi:hypothetical protein
MSEIPRGKYLGERVGGPPREEAEHFIKCAACGGWIDCRDLGAVFSHEGALTPPGGRQTAMMWEDCLVGSIA